MQKGLLDIQLNSSRISTEPELALITANIGQNKLSSCVILLYFINCYGPVEACTPLYS